MLYIELINKLVETWYAADPRTDTKVEIYDVNGQELEFHSFYEQDGILCIDVKKKEGSV